MTKRPIYFLHGTLVLGRLHLVWGKANSTFAGAFHRRGELSEFWFGPVRAVLWR